MNSGSKKNRPHKPISSKQRKLVIWLNREIRELREIFSFFLLAVAYLWAVSSSYRSRKGLTIQKEILQKLQLEC